MIMKKKKINNIIKKYIHHLTHLPAGLAGQVYNIYQVFFKLKFKDLD